MYMNVSVAVDLAPDERRLIDVVREIKLSGFGEFQCTIVSKEITLIRETYLHRLS